MLEERQTNHDKTWTRPGIRATWSGVIVVAMLMAVPAVLIGVLTSRHNYGNAAGIFAIFGGWFVAFAWSRRRFVTSFTCSRSGIGARTWYGRRFFVRWPGVGSAALTRRQGIAGLRSLRVRSPSGRLLAELPQDIGPLEEIDQAIEQRGG